MIKVKFKFCVMIIVGGIGVLRWILSLPKTYDSFCFVLGSIAAGFIAGLTLGPILVYFDIMTLAPDVLADLPFSEDPVKRFEANFYNTPEAQEQLALEKKKNEEFKDWVILGVFIFYGIGAIWNAHH